MLEDADRLLRILSDQNNLAELMEALESEVYNPEVDPELAKALLEVSYLIRLRQNDVGMLMAYWDDERFKVHRDRDYRPEDYSPNPQNWTDSGPDPSRLTMKETFDIYEQTGLWEEFDQRDEDESNYNDMIGRSLKR